MNDITESIWNDFSKELKGFIVKKVNDASVADDILQDVFVKIIANKNKVKESHSIQQYVYAMTRNGVYDYFRKINHKESSDEIPELFTDEETKSLNASIADCCIKPFIGQLPEKYQVALVKTEFDGVSQKELAKELNISYSGAKSRVQRGRERLKELLLNCCVLQSDKYGNLMSESDHNCNCS